MPFESIAAGAGAGLAGGLTRGLMGTGDGRLSGGDIRRLTGGIDAGGLRSSVDPSNRTISIEDSPERSRLVSNISTSFGRQARALGAFRRQLRPGFGAITRARRRAIRQAGREAVGDITENLARRRVLGSSFGADTIARNARRFGEAEADADAESFLQELQASVNLLGAESEAARSEFGTRLEELNLQTQVALNILTGSQAAIGSASRLQAALQDQLTRDLAGLAGGGFGVLASSAGQLFGRTPATPGLGGASAAIAGGSIS